ncbi:MAG: hypothetical protein ACREIV_02515 [Planctomycetaceae bacterium]
MLTVTESAGTRLSGFLRKSADETVIRIVRRRKRLKLRRDHQRPDDTTFIHDGRIVLVLDGRISDALAFRTLDVRQTERGPRLTLKSA